MSVRVLVIALVVQFALAAAFVIMAIDGFPVLRDLFGHTQSHTTTGRIQSTPASTPTGMVHAR
jgi:hypothetical protein